MQALLRSSGPRAARAALAGPGPGAGGFGGLLSVRGIGQTGVPDNYGQNKPGEVGTTFLGTPKNHREVSHHTHRRRDTLGSQTAPRSSKCLCFPKRQKKSALKLYRMLSMLVLKDLMLRAATQAFSFRLVCRPPFASVTDTVFWVPPPSQAARDSSNECFKRRG
jgi:hypothetical protein